ARRRLSARKLLPIATFASHLLLQVPLINPIQRLHGCDVDPFVFRVEIANERARHDNGDAELADKARVAAAVLTDERGRSAGDLQVENPLFLHGDLVDGAGIGQNRHAAAKAPLLEEKTRAVVTAVLFVSGDGEAERDSASALMEVAEDFEQNRELPFHVAAA